jgi:hypothetical protein
MVDKPKRERKAKKVTEREKHASVQDFEPPPNLDGKTDSGPEPDIFGREIPPQGDEDRSQ